MKSKRRADKSVLCPFYSEEDAQMILCEGVEDNTSLHLAFGSPACLKAYKHRFCCGTKFKKCRIARMLYQKYEEEDGNAS